jgi:hypothetical protein
VTLMLVLVIGLLGLATTAQAMTFGSGVNVTAEGGTYALVACGSASRCTVVNGGYAYTFSPTDLHAANGQVLPSLPGFTSFSCPSSSECVLLGSNGEVVSFDPASAAAPLTGTLPIVAVALACPSATECTAVGTVPSSGQPAAVMINPQHPGTLETSNFAGDLSVTPQALACASTTQCTIAGGGDTVESFSPLVLGTEPPGDATPVTSGYVKTITCAASTQCTEGDQDGNEISFNPQDPAGTQTVETIADSTDYGITALACASATDCLAGLGTGGLVEGNPQVVSAWASDLTAPAQINSLACPSAAVCVAVDSDGTVYTAPPPTSSKVSGTVNGLPPLTGPVGRATLGPVTQNATGLKLKLTCAGVAADRCTFILRLAAGVHAASAADRILTIKPGTVSTALPYTRAARALLVKDRKLKGTLVAVQEVQGGTVTLATRTITLHAATR